MAGEAFAQGSVVVLEARRNGGPVRWSFPHYVVWDAGDELALYLPIGSEGLGPADREALLRGDPPVPHVWHGRNVLRLITAGDWHDVWVRFDEVGAFAGWYVNFQVPVERRGDRLVMCDLELDILVEPDRSWCWKDRREYDELIEWGLVTAAEAAAIAADGEHVIARIEAGAAPFDDRLTGWRPDPSWSRPPTPRR
jgi:hypothetical protein